MTRDELRDAHQRPLDVLVGARRAKVTTFVETPCFGGVSVLCVVRFSDNAEELYADTAQIGAAP